MVVHPFRKGLAGLGVGLLGFLLFVGCCYLCYLRS